MKSPEDIITLMMEEDEFSHWMGLSINQIKKGNCKATCTIRKEMLNGFQIAHGGISYSFSDSLLAFASNAYGYKCVSIETSISHLKPVKLGETLTGICTEIHRGKTIGIYNVDIFNDQNQLISKFKGSVHISTEIW